MGEWLALSPLSKKFLGMFLICDECKSYLFCLQSTADSQLYGISTVTGLLTSELRFQNDDLCFEHLKSNVSVVF